MQSYKYKLPSQTLTSTSSKTTKGEDCCSAICRMVPAFTLVAPWAVAATSETTLACGGGGGAPVPAGRRPAPALPPLPPFPAGRREPPVPSPVARSPAPAARPRPPVYLERPARLGCAARSLVPRVFTLCRASISSTSLPGYVLVHCEAFGFQPS